MTDMYEAQQMATGTDDPVPAIGLAPDAAPLAVSVLEHLTSLMDGTSHDQTQEDAARVLDALMTRAAQLIEAADWASVTVVRSGSGSTIASSHPEALAADEVQYRLRSGPCFDAAVDDNVYVTGEIDQDERWPEYGRIVHEEMGVSSVIAHRLVLLGDESADAALNIYSRTPDAFDDDDVHESLLLATQCALLVSAHLASDRADNLVQALGSNREIGVAMGILMAGHKVTQEQAFDLLRIASQDMNRKLSTLAKEVAETGELPQRRRR